MPREYRGWVLAENGRVQIPEIELADLLIEVEQWPGFRERPRHAAGATPRFGRLDERLYAAVVKSGTLHGWSRWLASATSPTANRVGRT